MKPWQTMTSSADKTIAETARLWAVPIPQLVAFYTTYVEMFYRGPQVFWVWYGLQQAKAQRGELGFEPAFPHEVFPALKGGEEWFYCWAQNSTL